MNKKINETYKTYENVTPVKINNMDVIKVRLTEDLVNQLLLINVKNRNTSPARISDFSEQMRNGKWNWASPQGSTFVVNASRTWLLDGQTRLAAIKNSGSFGHEGFLATVKDEEAESVFQTIDTGRSRTSGQTLGALGMKNANSIGAISHAMIVIENKLARDYAPQPLVNEYAVAKVDKIMSLPIRKHHAGILRPFSAPMIAGALNAVRIGILTLEEAGKFLEEGLEDKGELYSATKNLSWYFQRMNGKGGSRGAGIRNQIIMVTKLAKYYKSGKPLKRLSLTPSDAKFAVSGKKSVWDI